LSQFMGLFYCDKRKQEVQSNRVAWKNESVAIKQHSRGPTSPYFTPVVGGCRFLITTMLTQEQKKRFQKIWQKRFEREISDEEADRQGSRLVRIMQLICEPTTASKDIKTPDRDLNKK
jgi:hypothetical protein